MSDFTTHFVTAHRFLSKHEFSNEFKTAFYYGVQGPDLFFYYKPITSKEGLKFGGSIHNKSPKALFEKDIMQLNTMSDSYRGYYFGVMLHFFGDEMMHQYIGFLCLTDKTPHSHEKFERDIDVFTYEDEMKDSVNNFRPKKFYKFSNDLAKEIYEFWHIRDGRDLITPKNVKSAMKTIVGMDEMFAKCNKFVLFVLGKIGRKGKVALTHFKNTKNFDVMNEEHKQWKSPTGLVNYSVYEILDITMDNFEKEYEKINSTLENKSEKYEFANTHTFSYGCE